MKRVMSAACFLAIATPVFAGEYYIVRDGDNDKECRIVETRPTAKSIVVIGDRVYVTREEAEKQRSLVCKAD